MLKASTEKYVYLFAPVRTPEMSRIGWNAFHSAEDIKIDHRQGATQKKKNVEVMVAFPRVRGSCDLTVRNLANRNQHFSSAVRT